MHTLFSIPLPLCGKEAGRFTLAGARRRPVSLSNGRRLSCTHRDGNGTCAVSDMCEGWVASASPRYPHFCHCFRLRSLPPQHYFPTNGFTLPGQDDRRHWLVGARFFFSPASIICAILPPALLTTRTFCPTFSYFAMTCSCVSLPCIVMHTSASLALNENWDPDVRDDVENFMNKLVPENLPYQHSCEGPEDMVSSLV